ncbi:Uncharacterised protein [Mycobacteroides abscessus subsp. bolletii]|uniref:Uncharacterized protein n=1 Tax=Mycobacteroides abscessus subsp. bolletii TaxID=319705 RepID=A0A9Q7SE59_9MYCO|nr:hypothetical protein [Mycobacteroides abscessus]SHT85489.1 Uncharacterised protein [Mycobacteroides abscessus subsp. bolletii]SHU02344.1 Uncharacterised protein [Mycobacteroides abscessus subsp. bolletii]SHX42940.1 Uncharacterised protein [Mycobacteroides abscessus subsp. bolletii]SKM64783.1 Uncharacterised protein [Mycobacteroides abscessus subsp. bolletii]SKN38982.1 Uncharacterised protein [Mycobacteroides abscessus subsp. bolletii]
MSDWDRVVQVWPALEWGHVPDDPFDPTPWFNTFYNDVDLDAIDWADEMRKLPGQFTQRLCFPGSLDHRVIAQAVRELTHALITKNERRNAQ